MAETIKPCPFCGRDAHIKEVVSCCETVYSVGCSDSECMGFETLFCKPTPEEAMDAWNRRAERTCRNELSGYTDYAGRPVQGQFRCSECGEHSLTMFDIGFGDMASDAPRYCPHCGARVVEEDE